MKRENVDTCIYLFCIFVLVGLTLRISGNAADYSCDKCIITLKNSLPNGPFISPYVIQENITYLIENYKSGKCVYQWDPTQGYMKHG